MILNSCNEDTPQADPQVKQLISIINGEMSKEELMFALSLKNAKSFRQRYLLPAISNNLIKMTQPDKPNNPTQKYRLV